jgi:hypothetical protein
VFENFKAFKAGWSNQGKHPNMSSRLVQAYRETAQGLLKRKVEIGLVTNAVATGECDVVPTAMTCLNLPFVIGGVWAAYALDSKSSEYAAVLDALIRSAKANYSKAPNVPLGEVFIDEAERQCVFEEHQSNGFAGSRDELFKWSISRANAAGLIVWLRSQLFAKWLPECLVNSRWTGDGFKTFAHETAPVFARLSTSDVTPGKERAYELFTLASVLAYTELKP